MAEAVTFDDVTVKVETDKALLVTIEGADHWIPKGQIHEDSEVWRYGDEGTLAITEWIAKEKGLL